TSSGATLLSSPRPSPKLCPVPWTKRVVTFTFDFIWTRFRKGNARMAKYRNFHGLTAPVFTKSLAVDKLLVYPQLTELTEELDALIWEGGVGLVTGEMGMGKTTALRAHLANLDHMSCDVAYAGSNRHPKGVLQEL